MEKTKTTNDGWPTAWICYRCGGMVERSEQCPCQASANQRLRDILDNQIKERSGGR